MPLALATGVGRHVGDHSEGIGNSAAELVCNSESMARLRGNVACGPRSRTEDHSSPRANVSKVCGGQSRSADESCAATRAAAPTTLSATRAAEQRRIQKRFHADSFRFEAAATVFRPSQFASKKNPPCDERRRLRRVAQATACAGDDSPLGMEGCWNFSTTRSILMLDPIPPASGPAARVGCPCHPRRASGLREFISSSHSDARRNFIPAKPAIAIPAWLLISRNRPGDYA